MRNSEKYQQFRKIRDDLRNYELGLIEKNERAESDLIELVIRNLTHLLNDIPPFD